ncbi:MAG: peroxiredoxin [Vicinamibacteria bacterium]|nr:peroxiredoxin [Vicinamibacteria bacterium]
MAIQVGERVPEGTLTQMTDKGPAPVTTAELFGGKKVVLFALPGAFTPTCSRQHLPGYVTRAETIKSQGVDTIACLAVNDVFVMDAWGKGAGADGKVLMLADGNADYTKALGMDVDLGKHGMGVRCCRFSMVVEDGVVKSLNVEKPGEFKVSSAEATCGL